jgi:hypothetical protein
MKPTIIKGWEEMSTRKNWKPKNRPFQDQYHNIICNADPERKHGHLGIKILIISPISFLKRMDAAVAA